MKKFVIFTDSCSDLTKELRSEYDISYIPMHYVREGKDYLADLDWTDEQRAEFYDFVRSGTRITTAQITSTEYFQAFENAVKAGYDVLSISCSSGLSASILSSQAAREEILKKYPDANVVCIDSLNSCMGLGLLCLTAADMRAAGKTLEETAAWLEEHKLEMHQECTPEKLTYFKQAGRVSAASAFFGGLLNIKPIIISDAKGRNLAVEKVKGRQTSLMRLIERMQADFTDVDYQKIYVVHADCPQEAEFLKSEIAARFPKWADKIYTSWIGPIIGATCGPGTLAIYYYGNKVTQGLDE